MIVDAVIWLVTELIVSLIGVLPRVETPSWLAQGGAVSTVFSALGSMSVWIPMQLAITVILAVGGAALAGLAIKLTRIIVSLCTGGGGSTG